MKFLSDRYWFEPLGQSFVFRKTLFSRGYLLSEAEKSNLSAALGHFQRRTFAECLGLIAIAMLIAAIGSGGGGAALFRFAISMLIAIVVYAPYSIFRQNRLVSECLAGKAATLDRMPFREAMTHPRPLLKKRIALKLLGSVRFLIVLGALAMNALVLRAVAKPAFDRMDGSFSWIPAMLGDANFWLLMVAVNAPLALFYGVFVFIRRQWDRIPDEP
jgi:hypothetical protein